jgi:WD40 repeat protein
MPLGGDEPATLPPPAEHEGVSPPQTPTAPLAPEAPAADRPGLPVVPGYEILGELGRGGMGVVYQARQVQLKRLVALKMILAGGHASEQELARFKTEAEAVARLRHPHIVQIYEVGEWRAGDVSPSMPYFSLEFCEGGSLEKKLGGTPQPPTEAALLVQTLARAMDSAHRAGIVHRDLKPANILLASGGREPPEGASSGGSRPPLAQYIPKITDFGLAKKLDGGTGQTATGAIMGTPSYMAPEQAGGQSKAIGPAADIYALGAILYELLTGRPPFRAETPLDTALLVLSEEPVPPRRLQHKVPRDLETICLQCLHKERSKRYPTAEALAEDLQRFLEDRPIVARPTGWVERGWRWCKRNRGVAAALVAVAVALLAGSVASTLLAIQAHQNAARANLNATEARTEKEHAQDAAELARQAESRASARETEARQLAATLQRNLYDVQLNAARKNLNSGLVDVARDQLERLRPLRPGDPDLRGFEWFHLYRRSLPVDHRVLYGSGGTVNTLAWSPDGKLLASASGTGFTIRLWDAVTGQQIRVLWGHRGQVHRVCFSPDGTRLASASEDGTMRIWRVASGRELHVCRAPGGELRCVAWRPDGKELASTGVDGSIHLWDAATGESRGRLEGSRSPTISLCYSPDGKQLATGSDNWKVCLWDAVHGKLLRTFSGHTEPIYEVAFSPNGQLLGSAAADATARLWNVSTGDQCFVLRGHGGFVRGIAFSPDSDRVATACDDRLVRLWDARTGKELRTLGGHGGLVWPVAFQPGGKGLAFGSDDATVRIWDLDGEPGVRNLLGAGPVAFLRDGRQLATVGMLSRIRLLRVGAWSPDHAPTLEQVQSLPGHWGEVVRIVASRDGRHLATLGATDRTARLWDAATGKLLLVVRHPGKEILLGLALDPTGKYLATAGSGGIIRIWDATPAGDGKERSQPRRELRVPSALVVGLAFSPDGRLLASGAADGVLRLWDPETGSQLRECRGHEYLIGAVGFHPNGQEVATGSADRSVRIWDVATGKTVRILRGFQQPVVRLAYTPDGDRLATLAGELSRLFAARENAPGELKLWDAWTGEELFADQGFPRAPWELAFSPDGHRLIVGCQGAVFENDLRLYEAMDMTTPANEWPVLYRDAFDRAQVGPAWKLETGQWSIQQGALRGEVTHQGRAAIDLRSVELPETVDVRYEVWTPHAINSECMLLERPGERGLIAGVVQGPVQSSRSEVTFLVEANGYPRIGGASGFTFQPGRHYQLRLLRQGKWLSLWIDGREIAAAVCPEWPGPVLRLQSNMAPGQEIYFAHLEIRAPAEAVRHRQLRSLVQRMWDEALLRDVVRAQIKTRKDLSPEESQWCLQLVESLVEDSERLADSSWDKVLKAGGSAEEYALALRQAQAVCQADPDNPRYLEVLGLAQLRAGQFRHAIATLQHAADLMRTDTGTTGPVPLAGLAMAYHRLGQTELARQSVHRLRDLMRSNFKRFDAAPLRSLAAEATALVAVPQPAAPDEEAIKALVIRSEEDGWMRHHLADYLAAHTDDVRVCSGRGEQPGPHDIVLDRRQLEAVRRVQFQGPPAAPTVRASYEDMDVHVQDRQAELSCRDVVHFGDDYQAYGCRFHLQRTAAGWRIDGVRFWPLEEKLGGQHTVYAAATWAKRDVEVDRLAKSDDLLPRIRALKQARRLAEAHALACQFTDRERTRALAWSLRGEMALEIGETADAQSAFQKALALDPGVDVPWYFTRQRLAYHGHQGSVGGLAFHPDGKRIGSGGWDGRARLWEAATGRELRQFAGHEEAIHCAAFSPDGKLLATGGENLRLWDVATGAAVHVCDGHTGIIYRLAFSPDGQRIVTASADRTARVWDVRTGKQVHVLSGHTEEVLGAAFSPDGRWIATASHDQTARLWDATTYAEVRIYQGHTGVVKRVEFSPDGRHLATCGGDKTVKLWDVSTGKEERTLKGHDQIVDVVLFSPDGRRLASGDFGGTVRIWDAVTGKLQYVLRGQAGAVFVLAYRRDGQVLASGGSDGVAVWDLRP